MNKLIFLLLIASSFLFSSENNFIPNASYYVIEGAHGALNDEVEISDGHDVIVVNYFTYDGNFIRKIEFVDIECYTEIKKLLDPKAPSPKPKSYKIVRWPEIDPSLPDTISDDFVVLYDKNKNIISSYRYDGKEPVIEKTIYEICLSKFFKF